MATILIIEDDKFLSDLLYKKLTEEKFSVLMAVDGEQGIKEIREGKPDLVLLDLILPGMNGFEVLKRAKEDSELKKIPVIVLSNLGQKEDVERAKKLGSEDYLVKAHFTLEEIVQKIRKYI